MLIGAAAIGSCEAETPALPQLELTIDGTAVTAPTIQFGAVVLGQGATRTFELKNLGPGEATLTGRPPILLERDDRLAFRVSQPQRDTLAAGETLTLQTRFLPTAVGPATARITIAAGHLDEPLTVLLAGEGLGQSAAALTMTLDGRALPSRHEFGAVAPNSAKNVTLRLENTGTAPLALGTRPLTLDDSSGAFAIGAVTATALAPREGLDIPVTFAPKKCGPLAATLTISIPNQTTFFLALAGVGGDNPRRLPNTTDTTQLRAPDLAVAVSDPLAGGEKRRVAIGNLTVGTFAGQVTTLGWDGCVASENRVLSATSSGLTATLFGNQVALSRDGRLMLVTARDQRKDAWLFALDPDGTARFQATLLTANEAFGHGRGAALSGDGATAFIGQSGASNGINNHGAVFAYRREGETWANAPEATARLLPSTPNRVELVGAWVATDTLGEVVVSGGLATPAGSPTPGPAVAFVWVRVPEGAPFEWGRPAEVETDRLEELRLVTSEVPGDSSARVAVSADGALIALGVSSADETRIHLFERTGGTWGVPTTDTNEKKAQAILTLPARPELRFALGATAALLVAGDPLGVIELARPETGWLDRKVDASLPADRAYTAQVYGQLALSPDGRTVIGVAADGAAWLIAR